MISKKLIAASTAPLLLSILSQGESYGYAIIQRVRTLSGGELEWTEGMLYPVLHRMEKQGLVEAHWPVTDSARKRKYYRLTAAGRAELQRERREWRAVDATLARTWEAARV